MKLSFPICTFNAHEYFLAISEKGLHENRRLSGRAVACSET